MNKKKLKCIEDYIFIKTLNLIAKNTNVSRENAENFDLVKQALNKSETLLEIQEKQIRALKLNDLSFFVLENELETANIFKDQERNIKKLKEMISKINM